MLIWLNDKPVDLEACRVSVSRGSGPRELLVKVESLGESLLLPLGHPEAQRFALAALDLFQILMENRDGSPDFLGRGGDVHPRLSGGGGVAGGTAVQAGG